MVSVVRDQKMDLISLVIILWHFSPLAVGFAKSMMRMQDFLFCYSFSRGAFKTWYLVSLCSPLAEGEFLWACWLFPRYETL